MSTKEQIQAKIAQMFQWFKGLFKRKPIQLCEDCEHCELCETGHMPYSHSIRYATCKKTIKANSFRWLSPKHAVEFEFCQNVRKEGPQCKLFEERAEEKCQPTK